MSRKRMQAVPARRREFTEEFKQEAVRMRLDGHTAGSVAERVGFLHRVLQHPLRPRGEPVLFGDDLLAGADDAHDLCADSLDRDVEPLEHPRRDAVAFAKQTEQDVLCAYVVVFEVAGLLVRESDDPRGLGNGI